MKLVLGWNFGALFNRPCFTNKSKQIYLVSIASEQVDIYGELPGPTGLSGRTCQYL